ncbi:hypothetical protein [Ornithinimicrobium sp. INDO-MA30-4]|nr:hypothetical protein [Ornithinimicrobium sp. INDO-MA30-4]UJH71774.1 hypothetical protein L0A91_16960 [Ornithinimicrobium sp. INDO-MA30-4]
MGYATTHVFKTPPGGTLARASTLTEELRELEAYGFDASAFFEESRA